MVITRGEIWWAALPTPRGSQPGYRRPVLIISADAYNSSAIRTVLVSVISSSLVLADAPGIVRITKSDSGLSKSSVVNVSQLVALDKRFLAKRVGRLVPKKLTEVERGLRTVLDLGLAGV